MTDDLILDIDTSGISQMIAEMEGFPLQLCLEMTVAMRAALQFLEGQVASRTPVNTGQLRASITHEIINPWPNLIGQVGSPKEYAIVMEFGRRPGARMPPVDAIQYWVVRKLGIPTEEAESVAWAIAKHIARHGIEGHYMFKEGLEFSEPYINQLFNNAMNRAVQRFNQ